MLYKVEASKLSEAESNPKAHLLENFDPGRLILPSIVLQLLIRDPPALEPFKVGPLAARSNHTEADGPEEPVQPNDYGIENGKDAPLYLLVERPRHPIHTETHNDDGKPECRVVMMDVGDTAHSNEWNVVQYPSNQRVDTRVVNLVHVGLLQVGVTTLPADGVENNEENKDSKTGGANPVDEWIAKKEVLDDCGVLDEGIPQIRLRNLLSSFHPHIRRPTWSRGHCQNDEARSSCLSGSGTSALLEVIIATLRWMKSCQNGDL
jgi:hypothetical protein